MFFLQLWAFQVKKEGGVLAMAKYDFTNGGKSSKAGLLLASSTSSSPTTSKRTSSTSWSSHSSSSTGLPPGLVTDSIFCKVRYQ